MIRAGFVSSFPDWDWPRQFPRRDTSWEDVEFIFSGEARKCEILFVYDGLPAPLDHIEAGYRVFIASEPQAIKTYHPKFLSQFHLVLTTDPGTVHPNVALTQFGLVWHAGAWDAQGQLLKRSMSFDQFQKFYPEKTRQVSIVSSNKSRVSGHRDLLAFMARVKDYFGDHVDVYGRGINGFADKLDVLSAYRYHISIENSVYHHYWTEKLADPFLALTYPLYHGCPNIGDYFPEGSFSRINIREPEDAIAIIKRVVESDLAERAQPALEEARRLVLEEYNLFAVLARVAKDVHAGGLVGAGQSTLVPERQYTSSVRAKFMKSLRKRFSKFRS